MIKKLLLTGLCTAVTMLHAVLPGDNPGEAASQLRWIDCSPMPLGAVKPELQQNIPELRAIVFMLTGSRDTANTVSMLESLRKQYAGKVLFCAITPDSISEAEALRRNFPDIRFRLAVDTDRKLTPEYMRATAMIFPMAFLMDKGGMILWRGEAVDLPEAIGVHYSGKLDTPLQRRIAPLIYTMQQNMRSGNMARTIDSACAVLDADPGNAQAMRMAIFAMENLNRIQDAWELVLSFIGHLPENPLFHFTALDLAMRYPQLRNALPELIQHFASQDFPVDIRCAYAGNLLDNFRFESAAVLGAKTIIAGTPMPVNATALQLADILMVRARLHYALGNLRAAESDVSEALQYFRHAQLPGGIARAEKQLAYFRALLADQSGE
ncbi:MAG: hypothetical protein IKC94_05730 [Lentisphaeria bacterium]|nr:hypothetical protein [Lentisphaeria bacterium]